jgi:peroxiredoxin
VTAFGVEHVYRGLRGVARRTAFLVDRDGTVGRVWRYDDDEVPDVDELLSAALSM